MVRTRTRTKFIGWIAPVILIILWQLSIVTGLIRFRYFPSPVAVAQAFQKLASSGQFYGNLIHTVVVTLVAWVIATILGVLFGLMIGLSLPLWKGVMASVDVLRSLPIIALVPVGVIIFGFTLKLEIVIATYAALWPIVVNTVSGVRQTRSELIDIGRIIRMTRIQKLWKLILPSALPLILVGLRLGLGLSLVLAIVTEIVGTPNGIGYALINAEQALHPAQMFVYILITGVIGYLLNGLFIFSTRLILPTEKAAEKR